MPRNSIKVKVWDGGDQISYDVAPGTTVGQVRKMAGIGSDNAVSAGTAPVNDSHALTQDCEVRFTPIHRDKA